MVLASWVAAPLAADVFGRDSAGHSLTRPLIVALTVALVWQFVLVGVLVVREQRTLRWKQLCSALWLSAPRLENGRTSRRLWLLLIPLSVLFIAVEFVPSLPAPAERDFATILSTEEGRAFLHQSWGWFTVIVVMFVFNTFLGEELLFRGYLLPRMNAAFGKADWVANGILFAAYHLSQPWTIPTILFDTFILSWPSRRFRSAWFGIIVHSTQSVFLVIVLFTIVRSNGS